MRTCTWKSPFVATWPKPTRLCAQCEMRHLKLAVAHIARYSPQLQVVKDLIAAGEIGTLVEVRTRWQRRCAGWRRGPVGSGSHVLDMLCAIAGDPLSCQLSCALGMIWSRRNMLNPARKVWATCRRSHRSLVSISSRRSGDVFVKRQAAGSPSRFGINIYGTKGVIDMPSGYGIQLTC